MSYIHRFVTTDPGEFTFGKRDEEPESELLTESEEIICLRETIRLLEAGQKRQEGEVWKGAGNRYFTVKNGRTVPTKRPADGGEQAKQPGKQDDTAPATRQPKAKPTEKPARTPKAKAPTVDELHDAIKQASASGMPVNADDVRALAERIKAMKVDDIKALRQKVGMTKGSGAKAKLVDELAKKMLAPEATQSAPKAPRARKKTPEKPVVPDEPTPAPPPPPKAAPKADTKIANVQQGREHVMSIMDKVEPMTPYEMEDLLATVTPESRESLDRAIWQLVRERKVFVQRENNPGLLSKERKAQLLSDGEGGYYQTIVRYGDGMEVSPAKIPEPEGLESPPLQPKANEPESKVEKPKPKPSAMPDARAIQQRTADKVQEVLAWEASPEARAMAKKLGHSKMRMHAANMFRGIESQTRKELDDFFATATKAKMGEFYKSLGYSRPTASMSIGELKRAIEEGTLGIIGSYIRQRV